ncbi:MAG: Gfo/Idh/MocA family oxidoreductase [Planctomycetes bacterium]|nr:Gfo/Idh/MocA family oxidoreductase [Planctomycetota bacterium]
MKTHVTRRTALKTAAAIAAPYVITSTALGNADTPPASDRVTLGHIGVGNRGRGLLRGFMRCKGVQSVAVSDAYKSRRETCAGWIKGKAYTDFRELLAREDIDAVVIATPDHAHVPIAVAAARAGKDAYVEKPLGLSIEQILACQAVFEKHKRIFQYGTQQRSSKHCRFGCELVRSGRIGKVQRIEVVAPNGGAGGSTTEAPIPADLDYDTWIGPAPMAPYTNSRCNPPGSYWISDYSIGYLGGWGAHPLDIMVWGSQADQSGLVEIEGSGMIPDKGLFDTVINWNMRGKLGDVDFTFTPGGDSTRFIGSEGWVRIWRGGIDANPKSLLTSKIGDGDVRLLESPRHDQNFVDSIRSRKEAVSPIGDAVRSDVISHLCNIAVRTGHKIKWDSKKEIILDDAEATAMLSRPLRSGWTL